MASGRCAALLEWAPVTFTLAIMLIAKSEAAFRKFLAKRGKTPESLVPEELLEASFSFFESVRAKDALPVNDESFGDALLFQWGTREALPPYYGACFYFDVTRQFISKQGHDDDAIFQLQCQLEFELSSDLRSIETGNRWCSSLEALPDFEAFAFAHPALAAVAGKRASKVEFHLEPV